MLIEPKISDLFIYPVKSCSANPLSFTAVRPRGLIHDRRWVIVDDDGETLTGREHAVISLIDVSVDNHDLTLRYAGREPLLVERPPAGGRRREIRVWSDRVDAADAGDSAGRWLSSLLGQRTHLCYMDDQAIRLVADTQSKVSFADAYPLLLTNTASLVDLSQRAEQDLSMLRFRPNIVVETDTPYVEDSWQRLAIGDVEFEVAGPCERCNFTTLDPTTADAHPRQEPLRTLATYRRDSSGAVCFGQNLIPLNPGQISVGDSVRVIR